MAASLKDQLSDLFDKINPGNIVGLDIGAHSIKICEIGGSESKPKVERFATFLLSEAALIEDEIQKPAEIVEGLVEAMKTSGISSKVVCLGLAGPNTMTKRLNVPEGTKDEIEDHIMWEAEQYITFGADDSQISFHIIGDNEGGGKDALVAAAKREVVEIYRDLLKSIKLNVKIVDLNVIALSNIFEVCMGKELEEYSQGTLLLDFGAQSTKIVVYKRNGPIFTKEIPVGGGLITEEIQRQMGVSYKEAEDLKTSSDSKGNLPEEIMNIINIQLEQQIADVRKNINFYVTQGSTEKVNHCFITGGASLIPGLIEKLSYSTGLDVKRLDILNSVKVADSKMGGDPDLFAAISPVAIGLAMRKFN